MNFRSLLILILQGCGGPNKENAKDMLDKFVGEAEFILFNVDGRKNLINSVVESSRPNVGQSAWAVKFTNPSIKITIVSNLDGDRYLIIGIIDGKGILKVPNGSGSFKILDDTVVNVKWNFQCTVQYSDGKYGRPENWKDQ